MKRGIIVLVLFIIAAGAAWAQGGPGKGMGGRMMYDPSKAETVAGDVVEVKEFTSMNGVRKGMGLILNSDGKNVTVHLGPQDYLEKQTVKIAAGDKVEITGVKTVRRIGEVFLAGEVKKGGEVLKLRDENGIPLWAGSGPAAGKLPRKAPVGC